MNVMELGAIGELVGGVAVIATLIYLAAQVRQNTKALAASTYQDITSSASDVGMQILSNDALVEAFEVTSRLWLFWRTCTAR